ncbi:MAG: PadR family transcriptional regulator [Chloroflexi bacterium]|nr:PadR family transcriptional regulator [Chloroflexota bacterium]
MLAERPMHGYEVIKEIERRFGGLYAPSPGTVYPTLQMLEDMGYVTVQPAEGKKVYTVTDEGRKHLGERQENVEDLRGRMGGWWGAQDPEQIRLLMQEFHSLMGLRPALHGMSADQVKRLRQVLERTRTDIEQVFRNPDGQRTDSGDQPHAV